VNTTPTILYIVRHGETEYNRTQRIQGRGIDSELNERGHRQAVALARRFRHHTLDALYSSTLRRARQTISYLFPDHPHAFKGISAAFDEMSWGTLEGRMHDEEVRRTLEYFWSQWRQGHFEEPVPGGESIRQVAQRAVEGIETVLQRHAGKRVVIVTHGRLIRVLLASILPSMELTEMHRIPHANTGVHKLVYEKGTFRACYLNCTRHLETLPAAS